MYYGLSFFFHFSCLGRFLLRSVRLFLSFLSINYLVFMFLIFLWYNYFLTLLQTAFLIFFSVRHFCLTPLFLNFVLKLLQPFRTTSKALLTPRHSFSWMSHFQFEVAMSIVQMLLTFMFLFLSRFVIHG
jgi:hypothetical protein